MTRHEDVYYTCNSCGQRIGSDYDGDNSDGHTLVEVTNTDPASSGLKQEFHLCAKDWLDAYAFLDMHAIKKGKEAEQRRREEQTAYDEFTYHNPGFEG